MTRSKAAIFVRAKRMFIASLKSAQTSSTSASHRASRSRANTAACSRTAHLAVRRFHERFTHAAKPVSNFCLAVIRLSAAKSPPARCKCFPKPKCSTLFSSMDTPKESSREISSRAAKEVCDEGRGVGPGGRGVYLDFADAIKRLGEETIRERYGNLFEVYQKVTGENAYQVPMRIYPAVHYTMGGLWVDYNLMSTIDGLHVTGEANFSDHGANRLGASALMQGLADGYFIIPNTIGGYLATHKLEKVDASHPAFTSAQEDVAQRTKKLLSIDGTRTVTSFHRELGRIMWEYCGMSRNETGLKTALTKIPALREEL